MLEKGSKIFAPSARFVGVVVKPGQMGLRPEVIRYPKKGQFSYLEIYYIIFYKTQCVPGFPQVTTRVHVLSIAASPR